MRTRSRPTSQSDSTQQAAPSAVPTRGGVWWQAIRSLPDAIRERPLLLYGLLVPLSTTVYGQAGRLSFGLPPIVPLTGLFLLLGLAQGGLQRIRSTWQASPVPFWLYVVVCGAEVLLGFVHRRPDGWLWVAGRLTFFVVLLNMVANLDRERAAKDALLGLTFAVGIIGLLTLVQASRIVYLPFGDTVWPGRTFGSIQLPFPRTMGLAMSPDKYGIMASVAVATLILGSSGARRIVEPRWLRAALLSLTLAGAAIIQGRGVYLTVLLALGLSAGLRLLRQPVTRLLARPAAAWWITVGYAALLVAANISFSAVAPQWFAGAEGSPDLLNVDVRVVVNEWAWQQLHRTPLLGTGHGVGLGGSLTATGVHNHFLEQLVATGLLGGTPYLLFHLWILASALRLLGSAGRVWHDVAAVIVVSTTAIYLAYQFFPGFFTSVFAVVCGLLLGAMREERTVGSS